MRAAVAEVRNLISEEQCWAISDAADVDISKAGWARAKAWATLRDVWGWTQRAIAERAGKSESLISYTLKAVDDPKLDPDQVSWEDAYETVTNPHGSGPRTLGTGQDEWYTPPEYLSLVRAVMGGIDLDPASCAVAQANVLAERFFSEEDDGLSQPWEGRIFLNPPYSQPKVSHFIEKLIHEHEAKHAKEAITLTTNNTDTDWFQSLARAASAVCFTDGRVSFIAPDGRKPAPNQGHVFAYLGDSPSKFDIVFAKVGVIFRKF